MNQNKVQFEEELYTRFIAEVPKVKGLLKYKNTMHTCHPYFNKNTCNHLYQPPPNINDSLYVFKLQMKLITPSALVERLKINASLARMAIKELEGKDIIKRVSYHHSQWIYTRATKDE